LLNAWSVHTPRHIYINRNSLDATRTQLYLRDKFMSCDEFKFYTRHAKVFLFYLYSTYFCLIDIFSVNALSANVLLRFSLSTRHYLNCTRIKFCFIVIGRTMRGIILIRIISNIIVFDYTNICILWTMRRIVESVDVNDARIPRNEETRKERERDEQQGRTINRTTVLFDEPLFYIFVF